MAAAEKSVLVKAPSDQVFAAWSDFQNFPKIMRSVKQVRTDGSRSFWTAEVAGQTLQWEAEITQLEPGRLIAWRAVEGQENAGWVRFEPQGDNTYVTAHIEYEPPYGVLGQVADAVGVRGSFENDLEEDLTRFAATVESEGISYYSGVSDRVEPDRGGLPADVMPAAAFGSGMVTAAGTIMTTQSAGSMNNMNTQPGGSVIPGAMNPDVLASGTQPPSRDVATQEAMGAMPSARRDLNEQAGDSELNMSTPSGANNERVVRDPERAESSTNTQSDVGVHRMDDVGVGVPPVTSRQETGNYDEGQPAGAPGSTTEEATLTNRTGRDSPNSTGTDVPYNEPRAREILNDNEPAA